MIAERDWCWDVGMREEVPKSVPNWEGLSHV